MKRQEKPRRPVSVEELIRVKKAERPSREFWGGWQEELRSRVREVAAEKRPWWKDALPRFGITVARWHVVLGATALASLVIVALEEYQPALRSLPVAAMAVPAGDVLAVDHPASTAQTVARVSSTGASDSTMVRLPAAELRGYAPGQLSNAVAMILTPERGTTSGGLDARVGSAMQANLGLQQPLSDSATLSSLRIGVGEKVALAKAGSPSGRSRYLHYAYSPSAHLDSITTDRRTAGVSNRLNEDELYETASSRLGARGDRLSLRF